ncbi:hypothetical protein L210DRAFT_3508296 [Boletus edulis BED1]|uniref:Uncharacterized protein n=1 Tax=Boletus edulis BED1 TaxID=1328754 RepID=A0AAD4BHN5_BOLED|nr:hypothetical protein L210DRAFT_3508296 [Boletus edulis BED1]
MGLKLGRECTLTQTWQISESEVSATTKTSRIQTEAKGSTPEWLTESSTSCQQCQIPTEQVEKLALAACQCSGLVLKLHKPPQLEALEEDLEDSITILKDKNCIFGNPLSVDELPDAREDVDIAAEMFEDDVAIIAEPIATAELITLAEQLEAGYISRVGAESPLELLHAFRAELRCEQLKNAKQTVLDNQGFMKTP